MKNETTQGDREQDARIVATDITAVLPYTDLPFWKVLHLLQLNHILLIPMISAGTVGYDGVGTAFMAQPSPIIITELAYPTHRGKVTSLFNTFYV
ncbi:hypothetical protein OIDMADRAFT_60419 [Oidiodendron maius Zn]|uniref:Major facilitator superfamily (MFS) profile domain-containing protein n=1 Tax=Oidiodendron maius (strain Zn) TaxID=913774 RepID=A0A0C3CYB7_OIDMZ|nr:hypothetical protein OIDMADRAFT_60419 [Oidiodendron maius Zn]